MVNRGSLPYTSCSHLATLKALSKVNVASFKLACPVCNALFPLLRISVLEGDQWVKLTRQNE